MCTNSIKKQVNDLVKKEQHEFTSDKQNEDVDYYLNIIESNSITDTDFLQKILPERPYFMKPWLRAGILSLLYAKRGVGKTWFCLSIALAITRNQKIGHWETVEPTGCLYIDGEMSSDDLQERLRKLTKPLPEPVAPLSILSSDMLHSNDDLAPLLSNTAWREAIYNFLYEHKKEYGILILDNLSSLTPGIIENEKQEWDEINQWLLQLRFLRVAVILVHHANKSGGQRGTSGHEDNIDISISLEHSSNYKEADGAVFDVVFKKARGITGDGIAPFTFSIHHDENDNLIWTTEKQAAKTKNKIIVLFGNGFEQKEIHGIVGCKKQYVSTVRKNAIEDEILTESGKFTPQGAIQYEGFDIDRLF